MASYPYNTARWARLRSLHLSIEPLCRGCDAMGILRAANTVDHVVPISEGGPAFPDRNGLASYCASCHGAKTARGREAGAIRTTRPRRGCDPDGNPLDPSHPWRMAYDTAVDPDGRANDVSGVRGATGIPRDGRANDRAVPGVGERGKSLRAGRLGPTPYLRSQLVSDLRPARLSGLHVRPVDFRQHLDEQNIVCTRAGEVEASTNSGRSSIRSDNDVPGLALIRHDRSPVNQDQATSGGGDRANLFAAGPTFKPDCG